MVFACMAVAASWQPTANAFLSLGRSAVVVSMSAVDKASESSSSIWESTESRMTALAAKGRALQQKYAVEISELQNKRVNDKFPASLPLSSAAIWREEGDIPILASGGAAAEVTTNSGMEATSSGGTSTALLGLVALAATAVLVLTEPAMVTEALAQLNINVDLSSLPEIDTAAMESQVQQLKDLSGSMAAQATSEMSQSLETLQMSSSIMTAAMTSQIHQASESLVASTNTWKDITISMSTQATSEISQSMEALQQSSSTTMADMTTQMQQASQNLVASTDTWKVLHCIVFFYCASCLIVFNLTHISFLVLLLMFLLLLLNQDWISSQSPLALQEYPSLVLAQWHAFQETTVKPATDSVRLVSQNINTGGSSLWSALQQSISMTTTKSGGIQDSSVMITPTTATEQMLKNLLRE
jgi:hypothetical protein